MNIIEYENYQEKKSHGESQFPYITYPCSIPLDFPQVPLHWHDEMELIYIKKGHGIVTVDYSSYHVNAGDIIVIIPGRLHAIRQEPGFSMEYENIIFQTQMLLPRQPDICTTDYFMPLFQNQLSIPEYLTPELDCYDTAAYCLNRADVLCQHRPPAYQIAVKAQLMEFFFTLFSAKPTEIMSKPQIPGTVKPHTLEKMKIILKYIENHYDEKITIEDVAQACGFSQSHFMKFFKSVFGRPFIDYLKEYRLIMASRLLLTSSATILEIAEKTGFDSLSYFNRSFKAMYGQTPREFRAKN